MAFDYTNYKQVEYIESDASTSQSMHGPYIDLNLSGSHYWTRIRGYFTKTSGLQQCLYGYIYSNNHENIRVNANVNNVRGEIKNNSYTFNNIALNTIHVFDLEAFVNDAYFSIDGNTQSITVGSEFNVGNRLLFAGNNNGATTAVASFRMYYCKIFDYDGNLVRDLVPAQQRSSPNKYGLYDTVGEQFYGTQNAYDFTGGPEVSTGCKTYVKVSGTWKEVDAVYVKVNGVWTQGDMNVKISGTWKDS